MRLATTLLAAALLAAPLAAAAPHLSLDGLSPGSGAGQGGAGTQVACNVVQPQDPGRGVVCAVEIAFCLTAVALGRPCAL